MILLALNNCSFKSFKFILNEMLTSNAFNGNQN